MTMPSSVSFIKLTFGNTFRDKTVSVSTLDKLVFPHQIEMCKALLWALPYGGSSLSSKLRRVPDVRLATTPSN